MSVRAGIIIRNHNENRWYNTEKKTDLVNRLLEEHWAKEDRIKEQVRQMERLSDKVSPSSDASSK